MKISDNLVKILLLWKAEERVTERETSFRLTQERIDAQELKALDMGLWQEFRASCQTHQPQLATFLGDGGYIVIVRPSATIFGLFLFRYLSDESNLRNISLFSLDTENLGYSMFSRPDQHPEIKQPVVLVESQIRDSYNYRRTVNGLTRAGAKQMLCVAWEDTIGLADIVFKPSLGLIDKYQASQMLGIHPETYTRLCRQAVIPGAIQTPRGWMVEKEKLEEFLKGYKPHRGRPKNISRKTT